MSEEASSGESLVEKYFNLYFFAQSSYRAETVDRNALAKKPIADRRLQEAQCPPSDLRIAASDEKSVRGQTGRAATIARMPTQLSSIAVYCGSNPGFDPVFADAAASLGRQLAERGIRLVYGGAHVGLMGTIADAVLDNGGEAHGVITRALEQTEIPHRGLTSLRVTETMHERKAAMADVADAFIMLPGGYGTFDEFARPLRGPLGPLDLGSRLDRSEQLSPAADEVG